MNPVFNCTGLVYDSSKVVSVFVTFMMYKGYGKDEHGDVIFSVNSKR